MKKIFETKWGAGILVLSILAFCSIPLLISAQDSTAEIDREVVKTASSSPELEKLEENKATDSAAITASPTIVPSPTPTEEPLSLEMQAMVLGAEEELNAESGVEAEPDENAAHVCTIEEFSKKTKRETDVNFTYTISTPHPEEIIKNSYFLGALPDGVTGKITGAASKFGAKYDVRLQVANWAQRGSFNIMVFYKETTNDLESSTSVCQFNLIVE